MSQVFRKRTMEQMSSPVGKAIQLNVFGEHLSESYASLEPGANSCVNTPRVFFAKPADVVVVCTLQLSQFVKLMDETHEVQRPRPASTYGTSSSRCRTMASVKLTIRQKALAEAIGMTLPISSPATLWRRHTLGVSSLRTTSWLLGANLLASWPSTLISLIPAALTT